MASANFKPIDLLGKQVFFTYKAIDESIVKVEGIITDIIFSIAENYRFCVDDIFYSPDDLISFQVL